MLLSRRSLLRNLTASSAAAALHPARLFALQSVDMRLTPGKYSATRESLASYSLPSWFSDAKFGIWAHWGPQSAIEYGDWYARSMYVQGSIQYNYHVQTYGHPTRIGYKDLIPQFKAKRWDPEHLMDLYKAAGAKYFLSMGVHHDNFDMWNSKYQPRWDAVATGPKRDIVGMWRDAARKRGLYFGVSEHLSNSFDWFTTAHTSDKTGPLAGVPYDGTDPAFADLYHDISGMPPDFITKHADHSGAMGREAPERWKKQYLLRVKDLIDQHQPDLLYTDGGIVFEDFGLGTVAELYNVSEAYNGKQQAVYFSKIPSDCEAGTCALDRERGILDAIQPRPWQTDTCIGQWHYKRGVDYKTSKKVIDMLVDIVSKNGNLLLNIPLPNSGELDYQERVILAEITEWMKVNGEGIYSTRPWKHYGEGPSMKVVGGSGPNETKRPDLTSEDIRFTLKENTLYAFAMGWPADAFMIRSLGTSGNSAPRVANVELLGYNEKVRWSQTSEALHIEKPIKSFSPIGYGLKVTFA